MKFKAILSGWILGLFALGSPAIADEMKESGEKAGTEDINIGVGELQEDAQKVKRKTAAKKRKKTAAKKAKKKAATKKMRQKKKSDSVAADKEYVRKAETGETTKKKKGNVEYEWKVEEGEN